MSVSATTSMIRDHCEWAVAVGECAVRWISRLEISVDWIESDEEKRRAMNRRRRREQQEQQRWPRGSCCVYDRGQGGEEWWGVLKSTHTQVPSGTSYLLVRLARRPEPHANAEAADVLISITLWRWKCLLRAANVTLIVFLGGFLWEKQIKGEVFGCPGTLETMFGYNIRCNSFQLLLRFRFQRSKDIQYEKEKQQILSWEKLGPQNVSAWKMTLTYKLYSFQTPIVFHPLHPNIEIEQ